MRVSLCSHRLGRGDDGEKRCNPSELIVLLPLMCEMGVSRIKSTWMVLNAGSLPSVG